MDKESAQFAILHASYERKALSMLLKEFRLLFKNIKYDNLSFDERITEAVIALNINEEALLKILYKIHYTIGLSFGRLKARQFRKENPIQLKAFKPLGDFDKEFLSYVLEYFRIYGGRQIKELTKTATRAVIIELRKGTKEGETLKEMQDRLYKRVNKPDFYKWQAMRIARTETTVAMNVAQELAMISSGANLDKIWITKMDGKERHTHGRANKQKVGQKDLFTVGGYKMKFPGDRTNGAPAKEIVNCRCTHSYVAKRDANGRLQFNDEEEIQRMIREMKK